MESESIEGKISSLQLSADGEQAVYVTDNRTIQLLDTRRGISETILQLEKPIQFVKIMNLCNENVILCRWEESILKVCILNSFNFYYFISLSSCYSDYIYNF